MKVNIIVPWDREKVKGKKRGAIHRFALYLGRIEGWTLSGELDAMADVNYVFGYADRWKTEADPWQKYRAWGGPLAGYFTHQEPTGIKHRLWKQAAETVVLRVAESLKYARALALFGPTERARIPVERDMFCLADSLKNRRPIIGMSGYCPMSGRKGQMLAYELVHYPPTRKWKLRAAGRGWPVPAKMYRWQDLPAFYQQLDVYLCTSFHEGGPLGVFEALSCGVPVVIPQDVGALDELPDVRGVYRYGAGDFDAMYRALRECVESTHDRETLRSLTEDMTIEAFCADHVHIFEKHFGGVDDTRIEPRPIIAGDVPSRQGPELPHIEIDGTGEHTGGEVWSGGALLESVRAVGPESDGREFPLERRNAD